MGRKPKQTIEEIIIKLDEEVEEPIFIKYNKYIKSINSDYLINIQYEEVMEILRYVEKRLNINYPLNMGCGNCIFKLVKLFASLKK